MPRGKLGQWIIPCPTVYTRVYREETEVTSSLRKLFPPFLCTQSPLLPVQGLPPLFSSPWVPGRCWQQLLRWLPPHSQACTGSSQPSVPPWQAEPQQGGTNWVRAPWADGREAGHRHGHHWGAQGWGPGGAQHHKGRQKTAHPPQLPELLSPHNCLCLGPVSPAMLLHPPSHHGLYWFPPIHGFWQLPSLPPCLACLAKVATRSSPHPPCLRPGAGCCKLSGDSYMLITCKLAH